MNFEVTILGVGAAAPTLRHNPTSQLVNIHDKFFLVDCGEGTQIQLRKYKLKFQRINQIFISHLHGDHFFGLLGLISSMHLYGRTNHLDIYGPAPLKEIVEVSLKHSQTFLNFEINFITTNSSSRQQIYQDNTLEIHSIPLKHRIDCTGFIFIEKEKQPKVSKSTIYKHKLSVEEIIQLKSKKDVERANGNIFKWQELTEPIAPIRKYAFCSDTAYLETLAEDLKGVDLLYHEATFMHDMLDRAKATFHSTAHQAAELGKKAMVDKLALGHFSARYKSLDSLLAEAQEVFPNTVLALEGMCLKIPQKVV
jgi:ribonuclease Z